MHQGLMSVIMGNKSAVGDGNNGGGDATAGRTGQRAAGRTGAVCSRTDGGSVQRTDGAACSGAGQR